MQRNLFLLLLASVVALAVVGSPTNSGATPPDELKALTVDQVAARLAARDGKTFIYDNNSKESWVAGHVPGAKWLDDENVTAATLPADMAATLIFYCHNEG
jgi:3-mercaptopyruvate sulfurtransferase SseA